MSVDADGEALRILVERATRAERERDEARAALALAYPRALQAAADVVREWAITRHQDDVPSAGVLYRLRDRILALTPECETYGDSLSRCYRTRYAAALSAEEQRRAADGLPVPGVHVAVGPEAIDEVLAAPEVVDVPQSEPWHARLVRLATAAQQAAEEMQAAEAACTALEADHKAAVARRKAAGDAWSAAIAEYQGAAHHTAVARHAEGAPDPAQLERLLGDA